MGILQPAQEGFPDVAVVAVPALLILALWGVPQAGGPVLYAMLSLLLPPTLLVVWIILAMLWTNYFLDLVLVTDRHIFYASQISLGSRSVREWDIRDVGQVDVHIGSALETFFKYGTVELNMRSGDHVLFEALADPEYVSAVILKQDDRYGELKETARKQSELLHFISHEVKGHLTKSKAAFAGIVEGDYGPVSSPLGSMVQQALADTQKGVETVMEVLDNADFKRGTTTLEKKPFDLAQTVRRSVATFRSAAAAKGLELSLSVVDFCAMVGDERKLEEHVIRNLLDNAIRYTRAGRVDVALKKTGKVAQLSVADTGVGIAPDDMKRLFTEGGHGRHSKEENPESTGFGLFIAKQIVEAHGGHISAHSGGPGMGATFSVELPMG